MKSFFKSYIITNIIFEILGFCFIFFILSNSSQQVELEPNLWIELIVTRLVIDIILMFCVALPVFVLVGKFTNFTWIHSILMWFLVLLASNYISLFFFGIEAFDTLRNLWLAAVIIGIVFMPIYKGFKKRAEPPVTPVNEVFK